jgi:hypothetical protein
LVQKNALDHSDYQAARVSAKEEAEELAKPAWKRKETRASWAVGWGMVVLAAITRFVGIDFPGRVV